MLFKQIKIIIILFNGMVIICFNFGEIVMKQRMTPEDDKVLFAEERKKKLVDYINQQGRVTVAELCACFSVSSATIRNDLRELDDIGIITRTHGGAIKKNNSSISYKIARKSDKDRNRQDDFSNEMAVKVLANIADGDTIILDYGQVTQEVAGMLAGKHRLTVVTNDLAIGTILENLESDCEVFIIGGVLQKGKNCTINNGMLSILNSISVDKAFMEISSFSLDRGAGVADVGQAEIKRQMLGVAAKVIFICQSSRLESDSFVNFAAAEQIDTLITDAIDPQLKEIYEDKGISVQE